MDLTVRAANPSSGDIYGYAERAVITVITCTHTCNLLHNFQEEGSDFGFDLLNQIACYEQGEAAPEEHFPHQPPQIFPTFGLLLQSFGSFKVI